MTQTETFGAAVKADLAALENLKVSYCTIRASISGQISQATVQVGISCARQTRFLPNDDELLRPGTLINVETTVRTDEAVVVPSNAVQVSRQGPYVFG